VALVPLLEQYFRGERAIGLLFFAIGLLALFFAFWTWRSAGGAFGAALAVPVLVVALAGAIGGPMLVIRTDRQVRELTALDAARIREIEVPRMAKVNANWPRLKLGWCALLMIGMVLLMVVKREWAVGLGLGLILMGSLGFTIDVFAERRAETYTRALEGK
jgi:hypothetical protein